MLRRYYYLINLCVTPIETSSGVDNTPNTPHLYTPCAQVCVGSTQLGRMLRPDGSPAETTPDQVSGYLPLIFRKQSSPINLFVLRPFNHKY